MMVLFKGKGDIAGESWIYDIVGYLVRDWPDGADQRDAIVGSIIRAAPHSNG